jgi:hypothetical protein
MSAANEQKLIQLISDAAFAGKWMSFAEIRVSPSSVT